MTLAVILAHPRTWSVSEHGFWKLVKYLFLTDPPEMLEQIAPIGRDLTKVGAAVCIKNDAAGGLLYFFGNDLWLTAKNNSGALRLRIERIEAASPEDALWRVNSKGRWTKPGEGDVEVVKDRPSHSSALSEDHRPTPATTPCSPSSSAPPAPGAPPPRPSARRSG